MADFGIGKTSRTWLTRSCSPIVTDLVSPGLPFTTVRTFAPPIPTQLAQVAYQASGGTRKP